MCQPLPFPDFRWIDDISNFNVTDVTLDSPTGYILEIDLEYPQHLHDAHADLPFCPTHDKPPGKRENKLATLYDKKRYVIHYHCGGDRKIIYRRFPENVYLFNPFYMELVNSVNE